DVISNFVADYRNVNDYSRVRGVRREVVVSGTQKFQGHFMTPAPNVFKAHYDALLADPENAVKTLDDKTAASMLNIISSYLASKI
ncbi:MAG: hypothetical protein AABX24_01140, partial [Nanoarchaeota archaeon]